MKKKLKFGFLSQSYEAPRAESVEVANEGLLCASEVITADDYGVINGVTWGDGEGN